MTDIKSHVDLYFQKVEDVLNKLDRRPISDFVDALLATYENGGTIYVFGNGGSAATAAHFCGDFIKGISHGLNKRFKAICLSDNIPGMTAIANDISYEEIFVEQIRNLLKKGDLLVGFSGSGNSANVVKAMEYAKSAAVKTVACCGYDGGKVKRIADIVIHAQICDMEISEDAHLVICHCIKRILMNKLHKK